MITHQKRTMEVGDALYGVTMRGDGVSAVISQRLREAEPGVTAERRERRPPGRRATTTSSWRQATTRWADDDVYGHMNNARYFELIDTAVNAHLAEATGVDIRTLPAIGVVAEVGCRYFREIGYPEPVDLGLVVDKVGTSSVDLPDRAVPGRPEGRGEAAAEGRFVHVYVDNTATRGRAAGHARCPSEIRAAVEPLLRGLTVGPSRRWRVDRGTTIPPIEGAPMGAIVVVLLLAPRARRGRSCVYVAYPHRGEETPGHARCVGEAMRRGVDALPTLDAEPDARTSTVSIAPRAQVDSAPLSLARPVV